MTFHLLFCKGSSFVVVFISHVIFSTRNVDCKLNNRKWTWLYSIHGKIIWRICHQWNVFHSVLQVQQLKGFDSSLINVNLLRYLYGSFSSAKGKIILPQNKSSCNFLWELKCRENFVSFTFLVATDCSGKVTVCRMTSGLGLANINVINRIFTPFCSLRFKADVFHS